MEKSIDDTLFHLDCDADISIDNDPEPSIDIATKPSSLIFYLRLWTLVADV